MEGSLGYGNATMRLRSGDRVRVDDGRGIVEVLSSKDCPLDQCQNPPSG
jgi:hypothetical protein